MNHKQFMRWLATQGKFNTLEELYLLTLYSSEGIQAVKNWIDQRGEFSCPQCHWRGSNLGTVTMNVTLYTVEEPLGVQRPKEEIGCCPVCQNIALEKIS